MLLEAKGEFKKATEIYDKILAEDPSNIVCAFQAESRGEKAPRIDFLSCSLDCG